LTPKVARQKGSFFGLAALHPLPGPLAGPVLRRFARGYFART
jgi:hypothetical protein